MLNALFFKFRDVIESCVFFLMVEGIGCNELFFTLEEMIRYVYIIGFFKIFLMWRSFEFFSLFVFSF